MKNAIILCSGGIDSVITAHYVRKRLKYIDIPSNLVNLQSGISNRHSRTKGSTINGNVYNKITLLFFNYGQKSLDAERKSVLKCTYELNVGFREIKLPELQKLSTSLINIKGKFNKLERKDLKNTKKESEKWYVPCRNLIFLSYALSFGESEFIKNKMKNDIFVGFKNEGKESFPDTTKEFVKNLNKISLKSTEGKCKIITPLIDKDKEDIVLLGNKLGVSLKDTFSCYVSSRKHCGKCLACMLRKEGFYWANVKDETEYGD